MNALQNALSPLIWPQCQAGIMCLGDGQIFNIRYDLNRPDHIYLIYKNETWSKDNLIIKKLYVIVKFIYTLQNTKLAGKFSKFKIVTLASSVAAFAFDGFRLFWFKYIKCSTKCCLVSSRMQVETIRKSVHNMYKCTVHCKNIGYTR